jgi:hypothetical protein
MTPLLVGGDAGEVGAVKNRVLQGARLEQSCFAPDFGDGFRLAAVAVEKGGVVDLLGHGCLRRTACLYRASRNGQPPIHAVICTVIDHAPEMIPSKSFGKRCASIAAMRPPVAAGEV